MATNEQPPKESSSRELSLPRERQIEVLGASLYPGAKPQSIAMVLDYCQAAKLDPFQKPVHIVPMGRWVTQPAQGNRQAKREWQEVDTIMPGVGLYRTQAARTGGYAGKTPPKYGPTKVFTFKRKLDSWEDDGQGGNRKTTKTVEESIEYPEFCEVTVFRLVGGQRCEFTVVEFWMENYATQGKSDAPNAMWTKRPFAQLAKCAEAQALRQAFPEVGAQHTVDEARIFDLEQGADEVGAPSGPRMPERASATPTQAPPPPDVVIDNETGEITGGTPPPPPPPPPAADAPMASEGHTAFILNKFAALGVGDEARIATLKRHGVTDPKVMTMVQFDNIRVELLKGGA